MRRSSLALAAALALLGTVLAASGPAGAEDARVPDEELPPTAPGELLVRFRPGVDRGPARAAVRDELDVERILPLEAPGLDLVELGEAESVEEAIERLEDDPSVEFAEPNFLYSPLGHAGDPDPLLHRQWGLSAIAAPDAWHIETGATGEPVIAVVDTGVDAAHPDLQENLWVNPNEPGVVGEDDDENGCIDDVHGCNVAGNGPPKGEPLLSTGSGSAHGTHVAGIVAARAHNATGIAGVCPGCRIMIVNAGTRLRTSDVVQGLDYARVSGAHVVNASWGCRCWSKALYDAILRLRRAGVLFVAAAGNDGADNEIGFPLAPGFSPPMFPASHTLDNVISVAASTAADRYPRWTNWGRVSVDIAAPGAGILSTVPVGKGKVAGPGLDYAEMSGTSMAAPHVAGVAGLILSRHPGMTYRQVSNKILNGSEAANLGSMRPLSSGGTLKGSFTVTNRRLNAERALLASSSRKVVRSDGELGGARPIRRRRTGRVSSPNDVNDVFKKRLVKGRRYVIRLSVPRKKDYDLYVWRPGARELWHMPNLAAHSARPRGRNEVIRFRAPATGVYHVQVMAWYGSSGRYTLTVRPA